MVFATVPLKTSPSGGARHPLEAYVLVRRVAGLDSGVYHYAADVHQLERLASAGAAPAFDEVLPTQWWYRDAGALVLLTAVFERTRWRYEGPRAYRAVLIEAGHVCQTFCLTATWLGLAPFCSMALADSAIENMLGLDGVLSRCSTRPVSGASQPNLRPPARCHPCTPSNDRLTYALTATPRRDHHIPWQRWERVATPGGTGPRYKLRMDPERGAAAGGLHCPHKR